MHLLNFLLFSAKEINQTSSNDFSSNSEVKDLVFIIYGLNCPTNINQGSPRCAQ